MSTRVEKPILSAKVLALVGAMINMGLVACQSAPATSKEPAAKDPAAATAPAAQSPASQNSAFQNTAFQNQAAPPPAAPAEPAVVKLTGSPAAPPSAAAAPPPPAAGALANKPAQELADKGAPKQASASGAGSEKTAEAKAPTGKTVQGNVVSEEPFSTWLQVTSPAKAGGPLQLEAVLVAKPPYHCNEEYPHKFKLSAAPAGLSYPEETVRGMKVTPERSVLAIPVNAQSAGKATVAGTLSFSVCTEERCLVEKRELSVALDVM